MRCLSPPAASDSGVLCDVYRAPERSVRDSIIARFAKRPLIRGRGARDCAVQVPIRCVGNEWEKRMRRPVRALLPDGCLPIRERALLIMHSRVRFRADSFARRDLYSESTRRRVPSDAFQFRSGAHLRRLLMSSPAMGSIRRNKKDRSRYLPSAHLYINKYIYIYFVFSLFSRAISIEFRAFFAAALLSDRVLRTERDRGAADR